MITRFSKKCKKHIDILLIIFSFLIRYPYLLYIEKNKINTTNTWAGVIGMLIFGLPFFSGLWIYSNKIKNSKKVLSKIIKTFIIIFCTVFAISFILFLFNLL